MIIRRETLKALSVATCKDDSRYALGHIQIQPTGACAATDGHVAFVATDRYPFADADFPTAGIPARTGDPSKAVFLPTDTAARLITAMPKRSPVPILAGVQIGVNGDGNTVFAAATDLDAPTVAILKDQELQFPALERLMPPADRPHLTVILAANVLQQLAKAAETICRKTSTKGVRLEIPIEPQYHDKPERGGCLHSALRIVITGENVTITGAVMPCRE